MTMCILCQPENPSVGTGVIVIVAVYFCPAAIGLGDRETAIIVLTAYTFAGKIVMSSATIKIRIIVPCFLKFKILVPRLTSLPKMYYAGISNICFVPELRKFLYG
jgi:hypothetical protein